MKAVIWTAYGPPEVLQLGEVSKPTPKDNQVLIRIHAATVTMGDCEARSLRFPFWIHLPMRLYLGWRKPTRVNILGMELAGQIEAVGENVTRFKLGDAVFAVTDFSMGAYAQYICLPESAAMAIKPSNMRYDQAAAVVIGGLESGHFLRVGKLKTGERILINGAGGSIGTAGVQLAKHFGAHVTAVDSAAKLAMLRKLGADQVIDYQQEDFTRNGEHYDVIFDVVGKSHFARSVASLKPEGRYLIANPKLSQMLRAAWVNWFSSKTVSFEFASHKAEDLIFLKELIEAGEFKAVIDRCYPLEEIRVAHHYVETGQKKGSVVLSVAAETEYDDRVNPDADDNAEC